MKKQVLLSVMLLLAALCVVLLGCRKEDIRTETTFTLTTTEVVNPLDLRGYFVSSGDPTTSGTFTMSIQPVGTDSIHCTQTLTVPAEGSITIISDCSMMTNTGAWYITKGTGAYANLRGNGSLIMSIPEQGPIVEALRGETWRQ